MGNQEYARRLGRHTALARSLAAAMVLGLGAAAAGQPAHVQDASRFEQPSAPLIRASVSGSSRAHHAAAPATANSTAATLTVSNCNDSGAGSLRAAVASAADGDIVDMSGLGNCTITLQSSIVTSVDNLTIQSRPNEKYPVINGQDQYTVFTHFGSGTLTLKDVDVEHGGFTTSSSVARGGCVFSSGNVNVQDATFKYCRTENTSTGTAEGGVIAALGNVTLDDTLAMYGYASNTSTGDAAGGIIWSQGNINVRNQSLLVYGYAEASNGGAAAGGGLFSEGTTVIQSHSEVGGSVARSMGGIAVGGGIRSGDDLQIKYSQVTGNTAYAISGTAQGGGIWIDSSAAGALITKYSSIDGNTATATGSSGFGGGVWTQGDVNMQRTTVSGNTAEVVGGMDLLGGQATQALTILESTISGNVSTDSRFGAGIYMAYQGDIAHSTITANIESNAADNIYGAGLSVHSYTQVDLVSNIISGNKLKLGNGSTTPSDINASNGGSNVTLTGDVNLIGFVGPTYPPNSIVTSDPGVEPLADNGGPTLTHALKFSSEAVDAGNAGGDSEDQRGTGFDRVVGARADIGAFELGNDRIFADGFESP